MSSSVDDLLDELNGLLDEPAAPPKKPAPRVTAPPPPPPRDSPPQQQTGGARRTGSLDDLDALLADFEEGESPTPHKSAPTPTQPKQQSRSAAMPSAATPSAGAGEHATGSRCSKCDLRVLRFVRP